MAIRAVAAVSESEEILFENTKVSLCLLLNRHARTLRVFDFRAGADPTKRGYVTSIAQREGVERVFTVVERDEVSVWSRLGFEREGTIPGFFKRSDAYVLGALVPAALSPDGEPASAEKHIEDPSHFDATYQEAKRLARETKTGAVRLEPANESTIKKAVAAAVRSGRALTRFDAFGRGVTRTDFIATSRGGFSLVASVERQSSFDNALVELLVGPRTPRDAHLTEITIRKLCDRLRDEGTVACFSMSPVDDAPLAAAWLSNGFRRTGVLISHLMIGGRRQSAFLWTRKLTAPADPED